MKRAKPSTKKKRPKKKKGAPAVELPDDVAALHIATSTPSNRQGFPPPIHHKLVGFGLIDVSKVGEVSVVAAVSSEDETPLLHSISKFTREKVVVNFTPQNFTLPVLRGAAFRTGTPFTPLEEAWYNVDAWFGGSKYVSMSDVAEAMGLKKRVPLDISVALKGEAYQDIKDQLVIDAFISLCAFHRQRLVEFPKEYSLEMYRAVVSEVRKKVRAAVKERDLKHYVSLKGIPDKDRFLLK